MKKGQEKNEQIVYPIWDIFYAVIFSFLSLSLGIAAKITNHVVTRLARCNHIAPRLAPSGLIIFAAATNLNKLV